ncbi:MAG TPA: hypothetical protein VK205_13230 [Prolixibacteraceae bacterium]|nr:hypothetical protein [Prolixibacteraceae bacterium]
MKSFFVKSTLLTVVVFTLGAILYSGLMPSFYIRVLPLIPLLFYGVTNLVHYYLLKVAARSNTRFTAQYMATGFIKMFFYMAAGIGYAFLNKGQAKIFLINFLLLYVIYTTFEVVELSKVVRQKS